MFSDEYIILEIIAEIMEKNENKAMQNEDISSNIPSPISNDINNKSS
ncbi:MAG: hypothetical protein IJA12_00865 [Oscillospiraceae bacterium]|nr:hypothetical protein [Oscillospiraceae bacterium]